MPYKLIVLALLLSSCVKKQELPILSYYIDDSGKMVSYTFSGFEFTDQNNRKFISKDIKNKVSIANFFFTRCPSICPKMRNELIKIAKEFENDNDFTILSFTIDPKNDSTSILKIYSENTQISATKWYFLRGEDAQLNHMTKLLRTSFKNQDKNTDFYHSSYVALIDKNQQIRGYYDLLDSKSVTHLLKDAKTLLK